jgi:hypothetical protein
MCGPASTLPAVVLSLFWRRIGGYWLIVGSLVSFAAFLSGELGTIENVFPFLRMMAGPMLLIGVAMLILPWKKGPKHPLAGANDAT